MGNAHFIEELGTGEHLGSLDSGPVPSRGDTISLDGDGDKIERYHVDAIEWSITNGKAWATLYVEKVTT